jgi:uncharacterized membrane protein YqjE
MDNKKNIIQTKINEVVNEIEEEFDINNIYSILKYIKTHYVKFLLLLLVVLIIAIVDYITSINSMLFTMPSPIIGLPSNVPNTQKEKVKNRKKK